jgi:FkbM family methyltransferase
VFLWTLRILYRDPLGGRWRTLAIYLRLELRSALTGSRPPEVRKERFFGAEVEFFDYRALRYVFTEIFVDEAYLFSTTEKRPLIVDCGSNIGLSVLFFKRLHPHARILAFEPDPRTFEILERNVEANRLDDVRLVNKALSEVDGMVDFYTDPDRPGSPLMSLVPDRSPVEPIKIPSVRLSTYLVEPVDFLKIDVEGVELGVVRELAEAGKLGLARQMAIEYHHHINAHEDQLADLLGLLEKGGLGYQISADARTPIHAGKFQNVAIYAYQKPPANL